MKAMTKAGLLIKAGLLAFLVGGGVALPVQDAEAYTRCWRECYRGDCYRKCVTRPAYRYRTVCKTYWRHGVKHRSCRRVKVYY